MFLKSGQNLRRPGRGQDAPSGGAHDCKNVVGVDVHVNREPTALRDQKADSDLSVDDGQALPNPLSEGLAYHRTWSAFLAKGHLFILISFSVAVSAYAAPTCASVAEDLWSARQCPGEVPSHWWKARKKELASS